MNKTKNIIPNELKDKKELDKLINTLNVDNITNAIDDVLGYKISYVIKISLIEDCVNVVYVTDEVYHISLKEIFKEVVTIKDSVVNYNDIVIIIYSNDNIIIGECDNDKLKVFTEIYRTEYDFMRNTFLKIINILNNENEKIIKSESNIKPISTIIDECTDLVIRTLEADAYTNNVASHKLARRKTHVMTVAKLCSYMSKEINKKIEKKEKRLNQDTMFLAGLLHDLCKFECPEMHDILSAVRSKDILTDYGYPEIGTELCFIIKEHSNKVKQKNVDLRQQVLKEADILSHLALTYFYSISDIDKMIDDIDKIIDEVTKLKPIIKTNIGLKIYKKMMRNLKQYSRDLIDYQLYNK